MTHSFNALAAVDATTLTIASGVVTANQFYHVVAAQTGVTDDLATITLNYTALTAAGNTYRPMLIIVADSGDTITIKHGTGNISLISGSDLTLNSGKSLYLFYTGSNWIDLGTSGGTSGSSPLTTKGDLWGYSTDNARVAVGTNDYPLVADSGAGLGVSYKILPLAGGGTSAATKVAAFDALSPVTTRGDIITRDASNNIRLAIGGKGKFLTTDGTDVSWGVSPGYAIVNGRLTLTTATPVTTTDVTGAGTIYFTPYRGTQIGLYDGSAAWKIFTFSELSIAGSSLTASNMYDFFVYDNAGTPALEALVWTNNTTRATALTTQDGIYVKAGATTRRYVGSAYVNASQQFNDAGNGGLTPVVATAKRHLFNYYNREWRPVEIIDDTASHTYASTTVRSLNNSDLNRAEFVAGVQENPVQLRFVLAASTNFVFLNIGLNSTTARSADSVSGWCGNTVGGTASTTGVAEYQGLTGVGLNYLQLLERVTDATTATIFGTTGTALLGATGGFWA